MATNEEQLEQTLDHLVGNTFAMKTFMVHVTAFLALRQPDPEAWARQFTSSLHASVDANEASVGDDATNSPLHEAARATFDEVGREVLKALQGDGR